MRREDAVGAVVGDARARVGAHTAHPRPPNREFLRPIARCTPTVCGASGGLAAAVCREFRRRCEAL